MPPLREERAPEAVEHAGRPCGCPVGSGGRSGGAEPLEVAHEHDGDASAAAPPTGAAGGARTVAVVSPIAGRT